MTESPGNDNKQASGMDDVGRLINYAGAREEVSPEGMSSAHKHVTAHWEKVVTAHKANPTRHSFGWISIAASLGVVALTSLVFWQLNFNPQSINAASIVRVVGNVQVGSMAATRGEYIEAETMIETDSESRLALTMASGKSLRVDTSSRLLVHNAHHLSLEAGAVYVDTHGAVDPQPIVISTPVGTAQDIGTQFQVRLAGSLLIVGVRDGVVEIAQADGTSLAINKGQSVELGATGRNAERVLLSGDPSWDWIETVVPVFKLQGATLEQYLHWYANESGVSLRWQDADSEVKARAVRLSGSIADTSLSEGLHIVQQISHFDIRIEHEVIWVKVD